MVQGDRFEAGEREGITEAGSVDLLYTEVVEIHPVRAVMGETMVEEN